MKRYTITQVLSIITILFFLMSILIMIGVGTEAVQEENCITFNGEEYCRR